MKEIISKYQTTFADWFNVSNAFAFWKARVALYAILKALGVGSGDEVIVPGYTCVMNINPIKYLGAKPVYVDIESQMFNINPSLIEAAITSRTKVIIAQHTYGYPCQIDRILDMAKKHNLHVIEDCCLAFGSTYKGKLAGTFGIASYFSFQWNKPFTTGLGGMAIVPDSKLADKIKSLYENETVSPSYKEVLMLTAQLAVYRAFIYPRTTAMAQSIFRALTKKGVIIGSSDKSEFSPVMLPDFFKKMSVMQAYSGLHQLHRLKRNLAYRREMTALYDKLLAQKGWPVCRYDKSIIDPVMVRYPVRIKEKEIAIAEAAGAGIELGSWFECPLHPIETPLEKYDYTVGMCPEAEKAGRQVVNLPLHPRVGEKTVKRTVEFITKYTSVG
jgi:dTDP-4-amino-4,6-dideoxygalactose transaminase